jgi:hypothetical protein
MSTPLFPGPGLIGMLSALDIMLKKIIRLAPPGTSYKRQPLSGVTSQERLEKICKNIFIYLCELFCKNYTC